MDGRFGCLWLAVAVSLAGCSHSSAPPQRAGLQPRAMPSAPQIGAVDFPTSCEPALRSDFNRAVTLLHHMTYPQARAAFRAISDRDPSCAMAQWGVAMTLFQPLWPTRPSPAALATGWQCVEKARELEPKTKREKGYIDAVAAFFESPDAQDYWSRIDRWESAMRAQHAAYPADPEANAFYALALLASARPGPAVQEHSKLAVALLLPIYEHNPDHPGAMHYIIHANDVPGREHENLDIVRRYEQVAPDNPHALHMPTHVYTRLGDWEGVIRGNLRAAAAALRYPAGDHGEFVWDEFPHAVEYLAYAYLQQGADAEAAAQIERLQSTPNLEPTAKTAFHLASTRARYALERHAWGEAAALVPRKPASLDWDRYPWPEAVTWFARGYGALRGGDAVEPPRALARLQELEGRAMATGEVVFGRQIQVLRLELEAWIAHAARDDERAVTLLQQALELEGATPKPPVTPAATLPAPEQLGDLLLELGRAKEALASYQESLRRFPRRFNGTLGVAHALEAAGDVRGADEAYCQLLALGARGTRAATLKELRQGTRGCSR